MALELNNHERPIGLALTAVLHVAGLLLFSLTSELSQPAHSRETPIDMLLSLPPEPPMEAKINQPDRTREQTNSAAASRPAGTLAERGPSGMVPLSLPAVIGPTPLDPVTLLEGSGMGPSAGAGTGANGIGNAAGDGSGNARQGVAPVESSAGNPPIWVRRPTEEQIFDALSFEAKHDRQAGFAVLSCLVRASGKVHDCRVLKERNTPRPAFGGSYEFGLAALRLSRHFLVKPPMRNNRPLYDIRVTIPVSWNFD